MEAASWSVAIDVGTTFCVVAARRAGGEPAVVEVAGQRRIPSVVVAEEDGTIVVGQAAENLAAANPARAVRAPKNRLGDPSPLVVGGRLYDATALIAELLRHLYDAAVSQHGGIPPTSVRLTHPASWGRPRLDQLRRAALQAGIVDPVLLAEPVAAALAYAHAHTVPDGTYLAVYDLGGGTFDAAVVRAEGADFVVVGRPVGEDRLGGELFDELLANAVAQRLDPQVWEALQLSDELPWQQAAAGLRAEARRVKEALSSHPYAELLLTLPTGMVQVRVAREELEALVEPYVAQSVERLRQAVGDAGLSPPELVAVCLSGGASYIPMVETALREAFGGVPVERRGDPKTAVAVGATLLGGRGPLTVAAATAPGAPALGTTVTARSPGGAVPVAASSASSASPGVAAPPGPPAASRLRSARVLVPGVAALVAVIALVAALLGRGGGAELTVDEVAAKVTTTTDATARPTTTTAGASTTSSTVAAAAGVESPVERFLGTEIRRRWQFDPASSEVSVSVTLTNASATAFRWHHDEPVPASLAPTGSVPIAVPAAELPDASVLRWWFELAPAQAATYRYTVPRQASWPATVDAAALQRWEAERAAAAVTRQQAILTANQLTDRNAAPGSPIAVAAAAAAPTPAAVPPVGPAPVVVVSPATAPPAPTVSISGPAQLCANQPTVIEGVATGAVSGVWTISQFSIDDASWSPTSRTQTLTPGTAAVGGSYRATLQVVSSANVAASAVYDFTVLDCAPAPTVQIQGPASLCAGITGYFTGVAEGAVLGEWDLPQFDIVDASWTPDAPTVFVTPNEGAIGGSYTFTLTVVSAGGQLATAQRTFAVNC